MRVAILNQYSSAGGGSRFARALTLALAHRDPGSQFDLFADASAVRRDGLIQLLAPFSNTAVVPLDSAGRVAELPATTASPGSYDDEWGASTQGEASHDSARMRVRDWALERDGLVCFYRWLKFDVLGHEREPEVVPPPISLILDPETVDVLSTYDVVYLAWPYFLEPFDAHVPVVATFHDFNFKHGFGNFSPEMLELVEAELTDWIEVKPTQPVSSSPFIARELKRFFPHYTREPKVVFLSTFAIHDPSDAEVAEVRAKYGLPKEYVVCPSNTSPHKNLVTLLRAVGQMKRDGTLVPLVLTGWGTGDLNRLAVGTQDLVSNYDATYQLHEARLEEQLVLEQDVHALGFVSDLEMDALIRGAAAVVAPSRYEAGSGPAVDAWKLGTLVISSDIPPVREQVEYLGTEAFLFDPADPVAIAETVCTALSDPEEARRMVDVSRDAMNRYSWDRVADGYLEVFRTVISGSAAEGPASVANGAPSRAVGTTEG